MANANTSGRMYRSPTCQIECNNKAVYRLPNDDGHIYSPLVIVIDCVKEIEYASMMRISIDGVVKNNRFIRLCDVSEVENTPDDSQSWRQSVNDVNLQVKVALMSSRVGDLVSKFTGFQNTDAFCKNLHCHL